MATRLAVIGVGHWHALKDAAYLTHLPKIAGTELVALHDPEPGRAEAVAKALDPSLGLPALFTDHKALLDEARPDFVLALGRHDHMAAYAGDLIDAAVPFLMEKPMGLDAREVGAIADRARDAGVFAAVPLFQRYLPFVAKARAMIADGVFGPLSHMSFRSLRPGSERYVAWGAPWMLDPAIAGGGCLRNVGLHGIDLYLHVLGEDAEVTAATISSRALGQAVEDYACVQLRSASGVLGTIEVGNTFPWAGPADATRNQVRADSEILLAGRDSLLVSREGTLRLVAADRQEVASARPERLPALAIVEDTIAAWREDRRPLADARDCARAMALVDAAYRIAG